MKTALRFLIAIIELFLGFGLGVMGILDKDSIMVIIGCMLIICGKLDLMYNTSDK